MNSTAKIESLFIRICMSQLFETVLTGNIGFIIFSNRKKTFK